MTLHGFVDVVRSKTTRLALSYLAVIMVLSVGFSAVLYGISASELNKQLEPPSSERVHIQVPGQQSAEFFNVNPLQPDSPALTFLRQRVAQSKQELRYNLVLLNTSVLLAGAGLSYVLARRTLRPIEAAMRAQSQFTSNASHELRTPLAAMRIEIEDALRSLKPSPAIKRLLKSNLEELTHLTQLSDGLLRLARETETVKLSAVYADDVVSRAINRMAKTAQHKRIAITDSVPPIMVRAHDESLVETLVILLDNAIKYSPAGAKVYLEASHDKQYGCLHVRDEGPGIAKKDIGHIFERFYRGNTATAGHGLGLSIAKTLTDRQRGELTVKNVAPSGALFSIKLPLYREKGSKKFRRSR